MHGVWVGEGSGGLFWKGKQHLETRGVGAAYKYNVNVMDDDL